jgi:DNA polymerase-3 subunit epsilon
VTAPLILDTETTGLNAGMKLDQPVSVAVLSAGGDVIFRSHVRPTVEIDPEAVATHGLSADLLADAPSFADIADALRTVIDGQMVVAWNAAYDLRIIQNAYQSIGQAAPWANWHCAMLRYGAAFGARKASGEFKWWWLGAAYEVQRGADKLLTEAHDAVADCTMTAALWGLMELGLIQNCQEPAELSFTQISRHVTVKGDAYARLVSAGGLEVNVFNRQWRDFDRAHETDLAAWLNILGKKEAGYVHMLRQPLSLRVKLSGEFAEALA